MNTDQLTRDIQIIIIALSTAILLGVGVIIAFAYKLRKKVNNGDDLWEPNNTTDFVD